MLPIFYILLQINMIGYFYYIIVVKVIQNLFIDSLIHYNKKYILSNKIIKFKD